MQSHSPSQPKRLGAPGSGRHRPPRGGRNRTLQPSPQAKPEGNAPRRRRGNGLERRLQPAPAARERSGTCNLTLFRSRNASGRRAPAGIDRRAAVEIAPCNHPHRQSRRGTPLAAEGVTAWNAGFSRHPLRESAAERAISLSFAAETPRSAGLRPASTAERRSKSHHAPHADSRSQRDPRPSGRRPQAAEPRHSTHSRRRDVLNLHRDDN